MVTSINKQMIIPEELCEAPFPEANDQRFGLPLLISDAGEEAAGERLFAAERDLTSALAFALNRGWDDGGVAFGYARRIVSEQDYRQDCEWDRWEPVSEEAGFEFRLTPRMRASAARFAEEYRRQRPDDGRKMAIVFGPAKVFAIRGDGVVLSCSADGIAGPGGLWDYDICAVAVETPRVDEIRGALSAEYLRRFGSICPAYSEYYARPMLGAQVVWNRSDSRRAKKLVRKESQRLVSQSV